MLSLQKFPILQASKKRNKQQKEKFPGGLEGFHPLQIKQGGKTKEGKSGVENKIPKWGGHMPLFLHC